MKYLKIGETAREAGVSVDTVRYYERRGLLPSPKRRQSGYRQYLDDSVTRIRFIKHAQELGFSLDEIADLLSLKLDPRAACGDVKRKAESKIAEIDGKIEMLRRMKDALGSLTKTCAEGKRASECPVLEALGSREGPDALKIDCYMSRDCGSEDALRQTIARALAAEKTDAKVNFRRIGTARAAALGVTGSPSVFINGKELQPQETGGFS